MNKEYDKVITEHYKSVAKESGLSSTSTMADEITRGLETDAIIQFVDASLKLRKAAGFSSPAVIMDVGCGNGYTLEVLSRNFPKHNFVGIEKSDDLRELALSRTKENKRTKIFEGDIRDKDFTKGQTADILICQRVLINLLDAGDQKLALSNIIWNAKSPVKGKASGKLLFIESFNSPLTRLNEARGEFELPPIPPAHHNQYLQDDFFNIPQLKPLKINDSLMVPNFLSTHYYVSRVLHPYFTKNRQFTRNSEFVKFFTYALNPNSGDYSPLKLGIFEKKK